MSCPYLLPVGWGGRYRDASSTFSNQIEELSMSIRYSTLATALLLGAMLVAGSLITAQAGEGCTKDKKKDTGDSAAFPAATLQL